MPQTCWLPRTGPERIAVMLLVLALFGCAMERRPRPPEPGVSRVYAVSQDALMTRLREVLAGYQIEPGTYDPAAGRLRAERRDLGQTGWAMCQPLRVRDPDGVRLREAEPLRRDLDLGVQVEGVDGGTRVTLRPVFIETSLNSFTNLEVTHRCRSTGTLERDLLGALAAEGA